ncbi:hypothetical protein DPMN_043639 [Dreissena polymorpha]|uniref:Uncharacterized protein n=1 Tax=Dreissena polymorpha TaxID=45954 RepID=A0A9D4HY46_DREPO|nr:hypothetical protein DPMN_043639 [Dreissena polymorpha]
MGSEQSAFDRRTRLIPLSGSQTVHVSVSQATEFTQDTLVDSNHPKLTHVNSRRPKSTQVDPSRPKSTQVNPSRPKSTQVNPSRPKSTQVNPIIRKMYLFEHSIFQLKRGIGGHVFSILTT